MKTPSIVLDQVDDGGSFGGVFVSSGIILTPFAVFFLMVVRSASFGTIFFIEGADDVRMWRQVGLRREGVSHGRVTLPSPQETWSWEPGVNPVGQTGVNLELDGRVGPTLFNRTFNLLIP